MLFLLPGGKKIGYLMLFKIKTAEKHAPLSLD